MSGSDGPHADSSPDWLTQAVRESCKSEQWNRLLSTVNDRIQTHISNFDLPLFSDMDEATQSAIVEKEFKELVKLKSPGLYHYSSTLNAAVDEALLARLRGQTCALQYNVDHLTNICTTAVKDILLNSPPDMASASRIFINRSQMHCSLCQEYTLLVLYFPLINTQTASSVSEAIHMV